jgi:protocatechuate 3,4-dioxygenase alpha subunit
MSIDTTSSAGQPAPDDGAPQDPARGRGRFATTPSQTVGPYLALGLPWGAGPHAVRPGTPGAIRLHGLVLDGAGDPVPDAMIETWQADPDGGFHHVGHRPDATGEQGPFPGFRGFGRSETVPDGEYAITTLKPGRVPWPVAADADPGAPNGAAGEADAGAAPSRPVLQAPHVDVSVFARGLLHRIVTRLYFGDEPAANAEDPLLRSVDPERRGTLIARPDGDGGYRLDIRIQGPDETVFFAL